MRASVALIGKFKRARSARGGVDARVNFRSVNMEATSKASSIPLISIVGKGRGDDGQEFLRLKIRSAGELPRQAILSMDDYSLEPLDTIRALQLPIVSGTAQREFQARVRSVLQLR
jgi:hypothetical protein